MSTSWQYRCRTCDEWCQTERYNNTGRQTLELLWRQRSAIAHFMGEAERLRVLTQGELSPDVLYDDLAEWLVTHQGHDVALVNEYGGVVELEKPEEKAEAAWQYGVQSK